MSPLSPLGAARFVRVVRWLSVTVAAAALVAALFAVLHRNDARPEAPAVAGEPAGSLSLPPAARAHNPVEVVEVARTRTAAPLELVGSVDFDRDRYAVVGPLVAGRVVTLHARAGARVHAGEVLAEIESPEVGAAEASYLTARARVALSSVHARRENELARSHATSERERELAVAQAAVDAAELRAAEQRLVALGLTPREIAATVDRKRVPGRVSLRAPIAGTIVKRLIALGQSVEPATDAFHVADLDHLWVLLDLPEKDVARVGVGARVDVRTESLPGVVLPSRVAHVEPGVDLATRTTRVRIEIDNRDGRLRPGAFVTAHIAGAVDERAPEALVVPRAAVLTLDGKPVVFVETAPGRFVRRAVTLGATRGDVVEVTGGLAAGERVAAEGAFLLKSQEAR